MGVKLKKAYFTNNAGILYFIGKDNEVCGTDIGKVLELHDTDHERFEEILNGIRDGRMCMCGPNEHLYIHADITQDSRFRTMPDMVFRELMREPDTIRLRSKDPSLMLL